MLELTFSVLAIFPFSLSFLSSLKNMLWNRRRMPSSNLYRFVHLVFHQKILLGYWMAKRAHFFLSFFILISLSLQGSKRIHWNWHLWNNKTDLTIQNHLQLETQSRSETGLTQFEFKQWRTFSLAALPHLNTRGSRRIWDSYANPRLCLGLA